MPKYAIKETKEKTDVIQFSKQEYDSFNQVYKTAIHDRLAQKMTEHELKLAMQAVGDLKYAILTDGYHRVEFNVEKV